MVRSVLQSQGVGQDGEAGDDHDDGGEEGVEEAGGGGGEGEGVVSEGPGEVLDNDFSGVAAQVDQPGDL